MFYFYFISFYDIYFLIFFFLYVRFSDPDRPCSFTKRLEINIVCVVAPVGNYILKINYLFFWNRIIVDSS